MMYVRRHSLLTAQSTTARSLKLACLALALVLAMAMTSPAQTLTTLVDFTGANGLNPYFGSLVLGPNGNYYGTTVAGGASGGGSVFEVTPAGALTTIYSFCLPGNCADGFAPWGGLVFATDGNLYGTTSQGGVHGAGTIFEITASGAFSVLYSFCSETDCADGGFPYSGLTYYNGILYGTTSQQGAHQVGTIFSISTSGAFKVLYSFCSQPNCTDGAYVYDPLLRASNGALYGVTLEGGANGWGTIFGITTTGKFTTLHSFAYTDGEGPWGGLVQVGDSLYGTTSGGGKDNAGTVFKLTATGKLTTIYNFCATAYCADGGGPIGTLIQGQNGDLYGTTNDGGTGLGTVFEITIAGQLTTLHTFLGTDGANPYAGVVQGSNGDLYGTTFQGGTGCAVEPPVGCGTVFSLAP
jgi:uncharacterized repeat protein (TIGR03803 family)